MGPKRQATVIVAENEHVMRKVLLIALEVSGYRAMPALDGLEAISLVEEAEAPKLLLTGLPLSGLVGLALAKHAIGAGVPVVLYASKPGRVAEAAARSLGVHRLLDKDQLSIEVLAEAMHAAAYAAGMPTDG